MFLKNISLREWFPGFELPPQRSRPRG
jgi:hypothetical protein